MANKKISELTALGRDAANTDLFEIETAGGQSRKATGAEVAALLTAFSLTVEEQDAAPSVAGVVKIKFPNASLSDEGSGVVSVTFPASYTQEQIEDIVGAMVSGNTESGISVTYDDTNGKLDFAVTAANIQTLLDGIGSTRGSILYRGASGWAILAPGTSGNVLTSNGSGADPSYQVAAAGYSDEQAQDAVGAMAETNSLQYTDATPELKVKRQMSITADASGLKLDGDSAAPGNSKLYGTNGSGVKGWYDQPSGGGGGGDFVRLYDNVLSSSSSSVTISSISGSYKHLRLMVTGRGTDSSTEVTVRLQFNSDTNSNYGYARQSGNSNGSSDHAGANTNNFIIAGFVAAAGSTSGYVGSCDVTIFDYTNTTFNKSLTSTAMLNSGSVMYSDVWTGTWRSTSAINSITVFASAGSFATGTRITLYGLN